MPTTHETEQSRIQPTHNRTVNEGRTMSDQTTRFDAVAKVTGAAKYGRDMFLDNQLFMSFVRCPWGAGTLVEYDAAAAQAVPGVVEVTIEGDEGRYHGHTVGYIVAEHRHALRRAMRALKPRWERAAVTTTLQENANDPPEAEANIAQLLAGADHVLEATYTTPVVTHSPLETHGASIDFQQGRGAIAYVSTQGAYSATDQLPQNLGLPMSDVEVRCEYVGGGFGSKLGGPGKEGLLAARMAAKYKRPTYCFDDRREEHLDTGNRPSSQTLVRIGINNDGSLVGGQIHTWGGCGIARGGGGVRIPSGRYELGEIQKDRGGHEDVQFNGGGPRAFRAPGCPQASFAEELMLDELALLADIDPLALRMRIDPDADRREMYEAGAELIGWADRPATGGQTGAVRRGIGMGSTSWGRFGPGALAEVAIFRDGSVEARTGTQDIGTGQRTIMGVVAAEYLGVEIDRVRVAIGSSKLPEGPGSGGSMTAHNTAPAMMDAAEKARLKFLEAIAPALEENADALDLQHGEVLVHGEPAMTFDEACSKLAVDSIVALGENSRNNPDAARKYVGEGHSHGAQFAEVEVDCETGIIRVKRIVAIQSCGRVISRKTAESQIIGGVIQGLSYALFENKLLDRHTGAMVNPNLEMYKIPGTADMPSIEPVLFTKGQTGVRSLGEPPIIPTAGAIACAVLNAIGRPVRDLPLTPDRVLAALPNPVS